MMKFRVVLSFLLFTMPALPSFGSDFGHNVPQILDIYTSARIMAMGGAGVGLADDVNTLIYNPAGLSKLNETQIQVSHIENFLNTGTNSLEFSHKFKYSFTEAVEKVIKKQLPRQLCKTGLGFKWKNFYARDTIRNEEGKKTGGFGIDYSQYTFGCAYSITKRQSVGLAINSVSENIDGLKGSSFGFDFGWHYQLYTEKYYIPELGEERAGERYDQLIERSRVSGVGVVLRNIGYSRGIGEDSSKPLPFTLAAGAVHEIKEETLFVWETSIRSNQIVPGFRCGMETALAGFMLRAGFVYTANPSFTFGFGVPEESWYIDYGAFVHRDLGIAHRFSYGVHF